MYNCLTKSNYTYISAMVCKKHKNKSFYLSSIKSLKRLHWRDTQRLIIAYRSFPENQALRNQIIEGNMHLVARVVSAIVEKRRSNENIEDLLSEGFWGLLNAIEKFDDLGSSSFGAYASFWIMQRVNRYLDINESLVRIPIQTKEKIRKKHLIITESGRITYPNAYDSTCVFGHKKGFYALSKAEDWELTLVERSASCKSLHQDIIDEFGSIDANIESIYQERVDINSLINALPDREKIILLARNGFGGSDVVTLEILSEQVGCTRERIRQLEKTGYERMKMMLQSLGYESAKDIFANSHKKFLSDDFCISPGRLIGFDDLSNSILKSKKKIYTEPLTKDIKSEELVFAKLVNFSFFTTGLVIPILAEDTFYSNIDKECFTRGVPYPIKIVFENKIFLVRAVLPRLNDAIYNNINIRWGTNNPIISLLQHRHKGCFANLSKNREFVPINCSFNLFTTNQKNVFILKDSVECD